MSIEYTSFEIDNKVYENPIFNFRRDAEYVLIELRELIGHRGQATIFDMYKRSLSQFKIQKFAKESVLEEFGWHDLTDTKLKVLSDGSWQIDFPVPVDLKAENERRCLR